MAGKLIGSPEGLGVAAM